MKILTWKICFLAEGGLDLVDQGSTSSILNGSFGSIESSYAASSIISCSSVSSNPAALSPRKSSLKKRHPVPPSPLVGGPASASSAASVTGSVSSDHILGFHNPAFGENRVGSIKRVRIASQSTDVWSMGTQIEVEAVSGAPVACQPLMTSLRDNWRLKKSGQKPSVLPRC